MDEPRIERYHCRWCAEPIKQIQGAHGKTWVHDTLFGAVACRDQHGDTLRRVADPPPQGRHRVGVAPGTDTQQIGPGQAVR